VIRFFVCVLTLCMYRYCSVGDSVSQCLCWAVCGTVPVLCACAEVCVAVIVAAFVFVAVCMEVCSSV
jgi:hypothetical protein